MPRNYRYVSADSHLEIDSKHWLGHVPAKNRDYPPRLTQPTPWSQRIMPRLGNFARVHAHRQDDMEVIASPEESSP